MANPFEFLRNWSREHANATAYDDEAAAEGLAGKCLSAAMDAGVGISGLIKAAGGSLKGFFLAEQDSAANSELDRQSHGD